MLNFPHIKRNANQTNTKIRTSISSNITKTQADPTQGQCAYCLWFEEKEHLFL